MKLSDTQRLPNDYARAGARRRYFLHMIEEDARWGRTGSERPYEVHVEGPHVTLQDYMVAGFTYRIQLEELLGGPARVAQCFSAWSKREKHGLDLMSRAEIKQAEAWADAHKLARRTARKFLVDPSSKRFVLKLRETKSAPPSTLLN